MRTFDEILSELIELNDADIVGMLNCKYELNVDDLGIIERAKIRLFNASIA